MRAVSLVQMPEVWRAAVIVAFGLLIAFVLGGALGYSARALATTGGAAGGRVNAASACPTGSHAVVYYTAHAWSCVSD